jgi:hypothetical protein
MEEGSCLNALRASFGEKESSHAVQRWICAKQAQSCATVERWWNASISYNSTSLSRGEIGLQHGAGSASGAWIAFELYGVQYGDLDRF